MRKYINKFIKSSFISKLFKKKSSLSIYHEAAYISNHFTSYLKPILATTPFLKKQVYEIRHKVYCEELAYEPIKDDGVEKDKYDKRADFCLIRHIKSDDYAGCVRVIKCENKTQSLPFEEIFEENKKPSTLTPKFFDHDTICEISRLAVRKHFRRRKKDDYQGSATGIIDPKTYSEIELRCFPFIAISLYMCAATIAIEKKMPNVFVIMEPKLARSLRFIGIKFIKIGKTVDFHGKRAPYYFNAYEFEESLKPSFRKLFKIIDKKIDEDLQK